MLKLKTRETRTSARRDWILDKAGMLFWQKGYQSTSMRDIADACKFQPANIYNYFKSKEDILFEVIRDITEQTVASIKHLENDEVTNPKEQMRSLIKCHFGLLVGMRRSSVLISDTGMKDLSPEHRKAIIRQRDQYDSILRQVIRRGINSGHFAVTDERVVGYFISSVIMRSSIWFSPKGRLSGEDVGNMMYDFVFRDIKAEKDSR